MSTETTKMNEPFYQVYAFERIAWNGFALYFSEDPEQKPRHHNVSRAVYEKMGQPQRILVVVRPVREDKNASQIPGTA